MSFANPPSEIELRTALSDPRFNTYFQNCNSDPLRAGSLYGWNASLSAALMIPTHFAEVTTRNAAAERLERVYGPRWPWSVGFEQSLPNSNFYSPKKDLQSVRTNHSTTGKIIAELKLAFWVSLFTARHHNRLWEDHIFTIFPYSSYTNEEALRKEVRKRLEMVRLLRNRIAHHEPVFTRNLVRDLQEMKELIKFRSPELSVWVDSMEGVTALLPQRP